MDWFPLALLATIMLTIINFGDKFAVESAIGHPLAVLIFSAWINFIAAVLLWIASGFAALPMNDALLLIIAGTTHAFAAYFYFEAVSQAETSRIVILLQLEPIFVLILSMVFRGEDLRLLQLVGFALILVSAIAVSLEPKAKTEANNLPSMQVLWLMSVASLIFAIGIVMNDSLVERLVVDTQSLLLTIIYSSIGYWVGGMLLYLMIAKVRHAFNSRIMGLPIFSWLTVGGIEATFVLRQFVLFTALSAGSAALVMVVGSTSVFFAIVAGWGLTLWKPHIFKEDIRSATLFRKALWAAVAFVGILLIR
jgi:drug/metabolite transporter (DMT)-like permease